MRGSKANLANLDSFSCKVRLLDDAELTFDVKKDMRGINLIEFVAGELDLLEKDYFGLRYVDNNKQRHWLDYSKDISKQLKECRQPYMFFFRVKFYPTDPTKLREEITRYQLYLQLKRDILHGRLLCPFNNITDLAAHIVQSEVGDFDDEEHGKDYISKIKLLPRQNERLEEKIMEYHKTLKGYTPTEAENRFLNLARSQDLYGVDPHPCKDQEDLPLYLGLTPQGIQIIREARRVSGFVWRDVNKVSYDSKIFYIQIQTEKKKTNYAFRLNDTQSCKHLWRCAVEHMAFYSEEPIRAQGPKRSALSPQNIFRRSKYKYSGKTEQDLKSDSEKIRRSIPPDFERKSSLRLSVVLSNNKQFQSMPNLGKIPQPYTTPTDDNDNKQYENNDSTDNTSQTSSEQGAMNGDTLQEFETQDFPTDPESGRQSMNLEEEMSSSNSSTVGVEAMTMPSPPTINVESVDDENSDGGSDHETDSTVTILNNKDSPDHGDEKVTTTVSTTVAAVTTTQAQITTTPPTPPATSVAGAETADEIAAKTAHLNELQQLRYEGNQLQELYKNPVFILLLIAAALIPIAVILQVKFSS